MATATFKVNYLCKILCNDKQLGMKKIEAIAERVFFVVIFF